MKKPKSHLLRRSKVIAGAFTLLLAVIVSCGDDGHKFVDDSTPLTDLGNPDIALRLPTCVPNYVNLSEFDYNLDWLAVALCKFGGDPNTTEDPMKFRRDLEALLNQDNEVFMSWVITQMTNTHFKTPSTNSSMTAAMHAEMSNPSNQPPSTLIDWDQCLYEIFRWGTSNDPYLIYIDVRDFDILTSAQKSKPLMVIGAYEGRVINGSNPVHGYYWDVLSQSVQQHIFASDEELEDFYDLGTHYVWRLDVEDSGTPVISWNYCEEGLGVRCGDSVCDIGCDETPINCPGDCDPYQTRTVRLEKIKFVSDVRIKIASGMPYKERFGNYEVAFSVAVSHGKNRTDRIEERRFCKVRPKVKKRHVKRYKWVPPSKTPHKVKGENVEYSDLYLKGQKSEGLPLVSEGFNPLYDRIYIYFYEHDWEANKHREEIWAWVDPKQHAPGTDYRVTEAKFGKCSGIFPYGLIQPNQIGHGTNGTNSGITDGPDYNFGMARDVVEIKPSDWTFYPNEGDNGTGRFVFEGDLREEVHRTGVKGLNTFSFTLKYE